MKGEEVNVQAGQQQVVRFIFQALYQIKQSEIESNKLGSN